MEVPKAATDKELKEEVVDIKKEYGVVKVGAASKEDKSIESIVEKDTKLSMDDANTIQDEKDVLMGAPAAASEKGLEYIIDLKKEYVVSEAMGESPSKLSLIFPIPVKERDDFICKSIVDGSLRWYEEVRWIKFCFQKHLENCNQKDLKESIIPLQH